MKVTVNIDCTPEEARRMMGLPDLTPVHEAYVEQLRKIAAEGPSHEAMAELIKSWSSFGASGMDFWSGLAGTKPGKS